MSENSNSSPIPLNEKREDDQLENPEAQTETPEKQENEASAQPEEGEKKEEIQETEKKEDTIPVEKEAITPEIQQTPPVTESEEIPLNSSNNKINTGQVALNIAYTDCYLIFRALCKLSTKELPPS